jgi:hypothetical protein
MKITPEKEYDGILTLSGEHDPLRQGRYLVHIDELMFQSDPETHGIWCQNHVHKWRITPSKFGEYGQYFPLQPGTRVVVKFRTRQITSGYIDRIRSDMLQDTDVEAQDCVEPKENIKDRDEQYIIFKTPKKNNVFYINENTDNEPNTIFLIYNRDGSGRRTVLRINEEGIHIYSRDNLKIRLGGDNNIQIDGEKRENVVGNYTLEVNGNLDVSINGNINIKSGGVTNITADGNINIKSGGNTNIQSSGKTSITAGSGVSISSSGGASVNSSGPLMASAPIIHLNGPSGPSADSATEASPSPAGEVVDLESTPGNTEAFNIGDNSNKLQNIESADTPDSFDG